MGSGKEVPPPSYLDATGSASDNTPLLQEQRQNATTYNAVPASSVHAAHPPNPSSYVAGAVPLAGDERAATYYIYHGQQTPIFLESSRQPVLYNVSETGLVLLSTRESVLMYCPFEGINVVTVVQTKPCFIGGEVLSQLLMSKSQGESWFIHCVIRDDDAGTKANHLKSLGVDQISRIADFDDLDALKSAVSQSDIVLHCADGSDHLPSANAVLEGLTEAKRTGRLGWLVHTSGVGVIMDDVGSGTDLTSQEDVGDWGADRIFDDKDPDSINALADTQPHRDVDLVVSDPNSEAAKEGVKTVIVIPPLVYGISSGPYKQTSSQVPRLIDIALKRKNAVYVGHGRGRWSHVHVKDLASLYILLISKIVSDPASIETHRSGYFFPESNCHVWADLSHAIANVLFERGLVYSPDAMPLLKDPELSECFSSKLSRRYFASNAVTNAEKCREMGWRPIVSEKIPIEQSLPEEVDRVLQRNA
ncbi:hypothetical protein HDU97_006135 [Phlyctochytrium planicorne]|nr:hypothetical protein HDU97_006135 [Phlyctochytrium planicorne]